MKKKVQVRHDKNVLNVNIYNNIIRGKKKEKLTKNQRRMQYLRLTGKRGVKNIVDNYRVMAQPLYSQLGELQRQIQLKSIEQDKILQSIQARQVPELGPEQIRAIEGLKTMFRDNQKDKYMYESLKNYTKMEIGELRGLVEELYDKGKPIVEEPIVEELHEQPSIEPPPEESKEAPSKEAPSKEAPSEEAPSEKGEEEQKITYTEARKLKDWNSIYSRVIRTLKEGTSSRKILRKNGIRLYQFTADFIKNSDPSKQSPEDIRSYFKKKYGSS